MDDLFQSRMTVNRHLAKYCILLLHKTLYRPRGEKRPGTCKNYMRNHTSSSRGFPTSGYRKPPEVLSAVTWLKPRRCHTAGSIEVTERTRPLRIP
jgi:hypothetical protein